MGAGYNTEFGNTNGSNSNPRFTRVNFVGSVKVDGDTRDVSRRVYQRNDRTLSKQYNNFRSAYWKWRAAQYTGGRKK